MELRALKMSSMCVFSFGEASVFFSPCGPADNSFFLGSHCGECGERTTRDDIGVLSLDGSPLNLLPPCHMCAPTQEEEHCFGRNGATPLVSPISQLKRFIPSISSSGTHFHDMALVIEQKHTHPFKRRLTEDRLGWGQGLSGGHLQLLLRQDICSCEDTLSLLN